MKVAKSKCCGRTPAQSMVDGRGAHIKGRTANAGYGFVCSECLSTVDMEKASGHLPVWVGDGKSTSARITLFDLSAEQAAGLKLDGWKIEDGFKASRTFLSAQGLDKALRNLPSTLKVSFLLSGDSEKEIKGKNDNRTYSKFAFEWVKDMKACGAPSLKGWNEDEGFELLSYAVRTGKNIGIREMMTPKMEEGE